MERSFYDKNAIIEKVVLRWDEELGMWQMFTCGTNEECEQAKDLWQWKGTDLSIIQNFENVNIQKNCTNCGVISEITCVRCVRKSQWIEKE